MNQEHIQDICRYVIMAWPIAFIALIIWWVLPTGKKGGR